MSREASESLHLVHILIHGRLLLHLLSSVLAMAAHLMHLRHSARVTHWSAHLRLAHLWSSVSYAISSRHGLGRHLHRRLAVSLRWEEARLLIWEHGLKGVI